MSWFSFQSVRLPSAPFVTTRIRARIDLQMLCFDSLHIHGELCTIALLEHRRRILRFGGLDGVQVAAAQFLDVRQISNLFAISCSRGGKRSAGHRPPAGHLHLGRATNSPPCHGKHPRSHNRRRDGGIMGCW